MRLTADLIHNSLSYINTLGERELDLRGHKIPIIENLGSATDHECIDFTDNDIAILGNFPLCPRLQTLLLARNRISVIQPTLAQQIPSLTTMALTQNQIAELGDLEPLGAFEKLEHLTMIMNPVTRKENYRYWVLYLCPKVRFLDFQKVKDRERARAAELFGTRKEPSDLAKQLLGTKSRTNFAASTDFTNGDTGAVAAPKVERVKLTEEEKKRVEELILNAKSVQEIERLETMLSEGRIPGAGKDLEIGGV